MWLRGRAAGRPLPTPHCLPRPWQRPCAKHAHCRCDRQASEEVTCGSRLREDHQLLATGSVTSCQPGRSPVSANPGGFKVLTWRGERTEPLDNSPHLHCKDRGWGDWGRLPCPHTSHGEADAFKGVEAWGRMKFFADSLPDFSTALNAEALLY